MDFAVLRKKMVEEQLIPRGISSPPVLETFKKVERHKFIPEDLSEMAYGDHPLPIGDNQTISQPYMVALMTESLRLTGKENILEVGTGSGYQAAVLAELSSKVYSIERIPVLAKRASTILSALGYNNIEITVGDGSLGWSEHAPYDVILVTASCPEKPNTLLSQLAEGGRLIAPIGGTFSQVLSLFERHGDSFDLRELCGCVFVPLLGKEGWTR